MGILQLIEADDPVPVALQALRARSDMPVVELRYRLLK